MSCFWDAVLGSLNEEEREKLEIKMNATNEELVRNLKQHSYVLNEANVVWQGEKLRPQLCRELKMWVDNYNVNGINNGHDTSSCDPFLVLLCHMLNWRIDFKYIHANICFESSNTKRTVKFGANSHHFFRR